MIRYTLAFLALLIVVFSCDEPGHCIENNVIKQIMPTRNRTVYYTDDGRLSLFIDSLRQGIETTKFSYDGFGRLINVDFSRITNGNRLAKLYYDASNRIGANRRGMGNNPLFDDSVVFAYNGEGKLSKVSFHRVTGTKDAYQVHEYRYPTPDSVKVDVRTGSNMEVSGTITFAIDTHPTPYPSEYYYATIEGTDYLLEHNRDYFKMSSSDNALKQKFDYVVKYNNDGYMTDDGNESKFTYSCEKPLAPK